MPLRREAAKPLAVIFKHEEMKQKLFILIAFILSTFVYSQNIVGKWQSKEEKRQGIVFRSNGTMDLMDLENPNSKVLRNITLKYQVKKIENTTYLEVDYFVGEVKDSSEKWKFRIENNILFLNQNNFSEENVAESVMAKKEEEYIRID